MLPPDVRVRVWYCVPPPQVREQDPTADHAPNVHPPGQVMVVPVHACCWMNTFREQAALDSWVEGGMAYRMRVWVPGPQLASHGDQVLLWCKAKRGAAL